MGEVEESGRDVNDRTSRGTNASPQPTSTSPPTLHIVPFSQDPLAYLARCIVDQQQSQIPDLTHSIILLSQARAAPWFRLALLEAAGRVGADALLGPQIETLASWIAKIVLPDTQVIAAETLELMLVEALLEYPDLYGQGSPYSLAASLMELFGEMTGHYVRLPATVAQFQQLLEQSYGTAKATLDALSKEATLVHTLWQAMHQLLHAQQTLDPASAYITKLTHSLLTIAPDSHIYIAGFHEFDAAEWQWLEKLSGRNHLTLVVQGETDHDLPLTSAAYAAAREFIPQIRQRLNPTLVYAEPSPPDDSVTLTDCINRIFDTSLRSLQQRARQCAKDYSLDPIGQHVRVFEAANNEAEAQAVEVQVRRWLTQGLSHIGIVTENRRLARRVRALLERAGVVLQDAAGWALSTTSAATVIERWLQCVEEDFHYIPFLDFLKSSFAFPNRDRQSYLQTIYHLEKSIIIDENIASGLPRYRLHTSLVQQRLGDSLASYLDDIAPLLDQIELASQPLQELFQCGPHKPERYLHAVLHSLQPLGVIESLRQDAAGNQVLNLFDKLLTASHSIALHMHWAEFRAWLGGHIEHAFFQPANAQGPVQLMSLTQSDLQQFDALIIAGAEQQFLPGAPSHSPFFNDAVRASLGIPAVQQKHARRFYYFRRLLQSTRALSQRRLLITWTAVDNDEELIPSPWLEAIQSFHALAYNTPHHIRTSLQDNVLKRLVEHDKIQWCDQSAPLPALMEPEPRAFVRPGLIPKTMSATAYQQVMNCPYQFFAARCLRLTPPESVREMLQKDDYGRKVHLCLQAFHSEVANLPGPFKPAFNEQNKQQAVAMLWQISLEVFAKDIEDNFIHRGWLKRWEELIPEYVQWQIQQAAQWRIYRVETPIKNLSLSDKCAITGQLDRIDQNDAGFNIIDYKTGKVPAKEDVTCGEAVQLPFYAMLVQTLAANNVSTERVEYLSLDNNKFGTNVFIEGEELNLLQRAVASRLVDIMQALHDGKGLPAWGDSRSCKVCAMSGLCRKGSWSDAG